MRCWSKRVTRYAPSPFTPRTLRQRPRCPSPATVRVQGEGLDGGCGWNAGDSHHGVLRRRHRGRRVVHPAYDRACGAQVGGWPHVVRSPPLRMSPSSNPAAPRLPCHVEQTRPLVTPAKRDMACAHSSPHNAPQRLQPWLCLERTTRRATLGARGFLSGGATRHLRATCDDATLR